jgi:hypothetical protein
VQTSHRSDRRRNLLVWAGSVAVALGLWVFCARTRMHLVDELTFIGCVAIAAAALTALYWWDVAAGDDANATAPPDVSSAVKENP